MSIARELWQRASAVGEGRAGDGAIDDDNGKGKAVLTDDSSTSACLARVVGDLESVLALLSQLRAVVGDGDAPVDEAAKNEILQRLDDSRKDLLDSARVALSYTNTGAALLWDIVKFAGGGDREEAPILVPRATARYEETDDSYANSYGGSPSTAYMDPADKILLGNSGDDFMSSILPPSTPSASDAVVQKSRGANGLPTSSMYPSPVSVLDDLGSESTTAARGDNVEVFRSRGGRGGDRSRKRELTFREAGTAGGEQAAAAAADDKPHEGGRSFFIRFLERSVAVATAVALIAVGRMIPEHFERDFGRPNKSLKLSGAHSRGPPFYLAGPDVLSGRG